MSKQKHISIKMSIVAVYMLSSSLSVSKESRKGRYIAYQTIRMNTKRSQNDLNIASGDIIPQLGSV